MLKRFFVIFPLIILLWLGGCGFAQTAPPESEETASSAASHPSESSEPASSAASQPPTPGEPASSAASQPTASSATASSAASQPPTPGEPASSAASQPTESGEPTSSAASQPPESSVPAPPDEDIIIITPNRDLPAGEPPQPDGQSPSIAESETGSRQYQARRILLTRAEIDGTVHAAEIDDDAVRQQILAYVDGMLPSDYNSENTPPGRGQIISVEVHRNDIIERYAFSSEIKDGSALAKNLQSPDVGGWFIADSGAFDYLSGLLAGH